MSLRELMENEMIEIIGDPNHCSRYGRYFYIPKVVDTKRDKKFNNHAIRDNKYNLNEISFLNDEDFLQAYRVYQRRYNTWM